MMHRAQASNVIGQVVFLRHAFVKTCLVKTVCIDFWWHLSIKTTHPSEGYASSMYHLSICDYPHIKPHQSASCNWKYLKAIQWICVKCYLKLFLYVPKFLLTKCLRHIILGIKNNKLFQAELGDMGRIYSRTPRTLTAIFICTQSILQNKIMKEKITF